MLNITEDGDTGGRVFARAMSGGAAAASVPISPGGAEQLAHQTGNLLSAGYVFSSHRGIYGSQRVDTPKGSETLPEPVDGEDNRRNLTLTTKQPGRHRWRAAPK